MTSAIARGIAREIADQAAHRGLVGRVLEMDLNGPASVARLEGGDSGFAGVERLRKPVGEAARGFTVGRHPGEHGRSMGHVVHASLSTVHAPPVQAFLTRNVHKQSVRPDAVACLQPAKTAEAFHPAAPSVLSGAAARIAPAEAPRRFPSAPVHRFSTAGAERFPAVFHRICAISTPDHRDGLCYAAPPMRRPGARPPCEAT